ncbi:hypothetical protein [Clostridium butyricum]
MIKNTVKNLRNQGIDEEKYLGDRENIIISARYISDAFTRYGWDYGMAFEGYQIRIPYEDLKSEKIRYISNLFHAKDMMDVSKVEQVNDYVEITIDHTDCIDYCYSIKEQEEMLHNTKEEVKMILKNFDIEKFEIIGLFYYGANFND